MRSENLRHFAATRRNRLLFFVVPVAIFVGFDLLHALRVGAAFPVFGLSFWGRSGWPDFNHFNRQSFGVLQLFKARTGVRPRRPEADREPVLRCRSTGLLFVSFLTGGTCPLLQPGGPLTVAAGAGLFPALLPLAAVQAAWRRAGGIAAGAVRRRWRSGCGGSAAAGRGSGAAARRTWWCSRRPR